MKENLNDLHTFIVVAQERSFTRAAAKLRTSQSAISQTLRNLEDRIGIKLLSRTTRSVAPTEAGEYLLSLIQPAIEEIEHGMNQLSALKMIRQEHYVLVPMNMASRLFYGPPLKKLYNNFEKSQSKLPLIMVWSIL